MHATLDHRLPAASFGAVARTSRAAVITGRALSGLAIAFLLTGYLGGAVATHVRILDPLFSHILFPVYLGAFIWGGLLLRDARLRAFLPWRSRA
jgi:hypothetical protein